MNILFISMVPLESNTSSTIQNKGIIKGFSELGHTVDIMTLRPNANALSYDESINDISKVVRNSHYIELNPMYTALMAKKQNNKILSNSVNIKQVTDVSRKQTIRGMIKKIYDSTAIYDAQKLNISQVLKLEVNYNLYDFIVSASDPKSSHLIAYKIFQNNSNIRAKWIQYWGDPMYHDITRKRDWRDRLVKYHENKLIKKADKIVYASPLTLKIQKEMYPNQSDKMDYASQVFVCGSVKSYKSSSVDKDRMELGYFGAYDSRIRNIHPLYEAALNSDYNLNICGHSDIKLESTDNIKVHGMVSYKDAIKMEEESDILITICNSSGTQIPGKIYYSAGYNKPIIVVLDGDYKEEIKRFLGNLDRYIFCENDSCEINQAVEEAKKQLHQKQKVINEQLTPKYMAHKILDRVPK